MSVKIPVKNETHNRISNSGDERLPERVRRAISTLPDRNITLSEIVEIVGNEGLLLLAALLMVIFLIPVSIPGFSTVAGILIFSIALSRIRDKKLWLPQKISAATLPAHKMRVSMIKGLKWFSLLDKISKPQRFNFFVRSYTAQTVNHVTLLAGSVLLMLPFGLVPFSNTLPAITIVCISIGLMQKDGMIILLGHLSNLGTLLYFTLFFSTLTSVVKVIL